MKLIKRIWWLIVILLILFVVVIFFASDIFISKYQFKNENYMILINNNHDEYYNYTGSKWQPIEEGKRIGTIKGWERYSGLWANIMPSGIYAVKNDINLNTLIVRKPLSEFTMCFCRTDLVLPEINRININRVELINESFPAFHHKTCNKGTTNNSIINDLINILEGATKTSRIQNGASNGMTILLYSDKLPGNAFSIPIWEMKCEYWMEYNSNDNLIKISNEILEKINGCK